MNWTKPHRLIHWLFSKYTWKTPTDKVYLTFDDGPIPEVTEWVLDLLKKENIKATFFCIGDNIKKNPEIFKRILNEEHSIGNHTYNHLNGWKTNAENYFENFELCENVIEETINQEANENFKKTKLFRPPFGKIKRYQAKKIAQKGYKIIMWSVLSYDFDIKTSPEECLQNVMKNTQKGNIIVFHDSIKASEKLYYVLPKAITLLKNKGFRFGVLD